MKLVDGAVAQHKRPRGKLGNVAVERQHHLISVKGDCQPGRDGAELAHHLRRIGIVVDDPLG